MINLEKYMIPAMENEDGKSNAVTEVNQILNKIGAKFKFGRIDYCKMTDLIEDIIHFGSGFKTLYKFTTSDLKKLHNCTYNEEEALDYFAPSGDRNDVELIKKYKPVPIYANGMGDHYCLTDKLEVKEYIHDARTCFDSPYARDYNTFREWLDEFSKDYTEEN